MKKFLLVDDHKIVRTGTKQLLKHEYPNCEIFEANGEKKALEILKTEAIDLVILDLNMPNSDPISIIQFGKTVQPGIKFLILSMNEEEVYAIRFLKVGINGYINKASEDEDIAKAVNLIFQGRIYFSENLKYILAQTVTGELQENPFEKLSTREFQIAKLLIEGKGVKEVSDLLSISVTTVSTFKHRIYKKLGLEGNSIGLLITVAQNYKII